MIEVQALAKRFTHGRGRKAQVVEMMLLRQQVYRAQHWAICCKYRDVDA